MIRALATRSTPDSPDSLGALSRRGLLGGVLGLGAAAGLAACGSSGGSAADPGGSTSGSGTPSSSAPSTRTVDSANGPIEVPAQPQRVVCVDSFSMAALFDLGLDPVGIYDAGEQYVEPQFLTKWKAIPKISGGSVAGQIDVEKVAALNPDLILGIDAMKPPYDELKAIAPTVILSFSTATHPWKQMPAATAEAVGLTSALTTLEQQYAARTAELKKTYASVLAKTRWDILQGGFDQGQFWLYGPKSDTGGILADAGARFASGSAGVGVEKGISYEEIGTLHDSDAILYYTTNDGKPANLAPALFGQTLWKQLPAVQAGRLYGTIYYLPTCYSDALGLLDDFEKSLQALGGAA
jgi:iron complex transport system substrate-binding protein